MCRASSSGRRSSPATGFAFAEVSKAAWTSTADVKRLSANASIVSADRIVFNIKGDDYRLVVAVDFERAIVWIKWVGAHKDYDETLGRCSMATELKPIRSEADYDAAMEEVATFWGAKSGAPEGDRLDVLATLIDAHEAKHHAMDAPDPVEAIKFRMEQQGLTRRDLEGVIGARARIAEVLNGKRGLSIDMIRRLHSKLGIPAEVLIRPSRREAA